MQELELMHATLEAEERAITEEEEKRAEEISSEDRHN